MLSHGDRPFEPKQEVGEIASTGSGVKTVRCGGTSSGGDESRLKVAFFVDVFPRVSNTFILNQITGLLDLGHEVDIFARTVKTSAVVDDRLQGYRLDERLRHLTIPRNPLLRVFTVAGQLAKPYSWSRATLGALNLKRYGPEVFNLGQLYTVLSFLRNSNYHVLHAQFGQLGRMLLPLFESGATRARLVVSFRGADLSKFLEREPRSYDVLFRSAALLLPVSEYFSRRLEALGAPPERIAVLHSGIELERFQFRERTLTPGEPVQLLFIGRLTEKKGISYVVEATRKAVESGRDVELTIVGAGELEEDVRRQVERAHIGSRVKLEGAQPSALITQYLAAAHLLIAPSVTASSGDQEGIPNVLKEAMASGLPVLSTRHAGVPELVDDGLSGYLVDERDTESLSRRLIELVDNPQRWPAMGREGRRKVEAEFDSTTLCRRLVDLYRRTLAT